MTKQLDIRTSSIVTLEDADRTLKKIAAAEGVIPHLKKVLKNTKDPLEREQFMKAVVTKVMGQVQYTIWRDSVVVHGDGPGRGHKGKKEISEPKSLLPAADPGSVVIHRWHKRWFAKNGEDIWKPNKKSINQVVKNEGLWCQRTLEQQKSGTVRGTEGTGEFERYTPAQYIALARLVLGGIDLDPATSPRAQIVVKAKKFFTAETNGLNKEWHGRVWLNPPYHRELAPAFIEKLIKEVEAGRTTQAIMLTNNCTDTDWFNVALRECASLCFTNGRIRFLEPNGKEVFPTQGQVFFYYGSRKKKFEDEFSDIGNCMRPSSPYRKG